MAHNEHLLEFIKDNGSYSKYGHECGIVEQFINRTAKYVGGGHQAEAYGRNEQRIHFVGDAVGKKANLSVF